MKQERGRLVVFEGIDGAGKSTQIHLLKGYLEELGIRVVTSYEPTHGEWGMRVRAAAAAGKRLPVQEEIDCLLRDRRAHVQQIILPTLAEGAWVLSDRYYPSMLAYQGATGADTAELRQRNEEFAPPPDMAFWLDLPTADALSRVQQRGEKRDAFEQVAFLDACARIYADFRAPWWCRIDATGDTASVQAAVRVCVGALLRGGADRQ